ncbi:MAG: twin-arginine translocase subunit TatC [Planctomycetota bacterium]
MAKSVYEPDDPLLMPLGDHLEDLRRRLILGLLVPIPIFVLCLVFGGQLVSFLTQPVIDSLTAANQPSRLLATSPLETFGAYLKVATVVTILVSFPWLIYQLWLFIAPGLHRAEKRFVRVLVPMSAVLTLAGSAFLYYVLLPVSLFFLITFGTLLVQTSPAKAPLPEDVVLPAIPVLEADPTEAPSGSYWLNEKLNELRFQIGEDTVGIPLRAGGVIAQEYRMGVYISIVFTLGLVFTIAFQLPVVMLLLHWVGILEPRDITPYRKQAVMACTVLGAVLTPQDPWSMIAMGFALYLLFESGVILMRLLPASRVAKGFATDGDEGDE